MVPITVMRLCRCDGLGTVVAAIFEGCAHTLPEGDSFCQLSAVGCFGRTSSLALREPAVNGGFTDPKDLGNLGMGNVPSSIERLRGHPELAPAVEPEQFDLSLS